LKFKCCNVEGEGNSGLGCVLPQIPWWITRWEFQPAIFGVELTRVIGIVLIIVGAPGLLDSFARFALQGRGTPAPLAPTRYLVVTGLYRFVRNPMYVAVVAVVLGQAALFSEYDTYQVNVPRWISTTDPLATEYKRSNLEYSVSIKQLLVLAVTRLADTQSSLAT
jgi:Phospholipid methyltransferase